MLATTQKLATSRGTVKSLNRHFIFVLGKGGVGKTTVALALARIAAAEGRHVLLAMTNAQERVSSMLRCPPIGHSITHVESNLDAVNITPQSALEEYGKMILKTRVVYRAVFENRLVQAFLHGTPGLEAWAMLGKAFYHADPPEGPAQYDLVILDALATGHALDMLRVPSVLHRVAPPGLLRREADRAVRLFQDAQKAGAILVSLPEEMPVNETIELHDVLSSELRIPTIGVVVNRVLPRLFEAGSSERLATARTRVRENPDLSNVLHAGYRRSLREEIQLSSKERLLNTLRVPALELPDLMARPMDRSALGDLQTLLAQDFVAA